DEAARSRRRAFPRREPGRRPAHLLRRFAHLLRFGQEQCHRLSRRLGHGGRRRRSPHTVRSLPRGAEAGRPLRPAGGARRRAAFLDRRSAGGGRQPVGVLCASPVALSAGESMRTLLLLLAFASCACGQDYPAHAVRIVVAFPAGGGSDLAARVVGAKLAERVGQPVVIENRVGANGGVGAEAVARAAPDGYTLVMGSNANITTNPHLMTLAYDPMKDLAPVAMLTRTEE